MSSVLSELGEILPGGMLLLAFSSPWARRGRESATGAGGAATIWPQFSRSHLRREWVKCKRAGMWTFSGGSACVSRGWPGRSAELRLQYVSLGHSAVVRILVIASAARDGRKSTDRSVCATGAHLKVAAT